MFSIYDMYILGSCLVALLGWCICVWFDKDNRTNQSVNRNVHIKRRVK
jgi:hypothetical protein